MNVAKRYLCLEMRITFFHAEDVITGSLADGVGISWDTEKWGSENFGEGNG